VIGQSATAEPATYRIIDTSHALGAILSSVKTSREIEQDVRFLSNQSRGTAGLSIAGPGGHAQQTLRSVEDAVYDHCTRLPYSQALGLLLSEGITRWKPSRRPGGPDWVPIRTPGAWSDIARLRSVLLSSRDMLEDMVWGIELHRLKPAIDEKRYAVDQVADARTPTRAEMRLASGTASMLLDSVTRPARLI
jgi:hypothetical protein